MKMGQVHTMVLAAAALLSASAAQAQKIAPGWWEVQTDMQFPDQPQLQAQMAQMQAQLKNLPPEARQMLEKQMGGMRLTGPNTVQMCVTPEMANSDMAGGLEQDGCTFTKLSQSANTFKGRMRCEQQKSEGEFTTVLHGPEHYATDAQLKAPQGRILLKSEARRIAAQCPPGQATPLGSPAKKP